MVSYKKAPIFITIRLLNDVLMDVNIDSIVAVTRKKISAIKPKGFALDNPPPKGARQITTIHISGVGEVETQTPYENIKEFLKPKQL